MTSGVSLKLKELGTDNSRKAKSGQYPEPMIFGISEQFVEQRRQETDRTQH